MAQKYEQYRYTNNSECMFTYPTLLYPTLLACIHTSSTYLTKSCDLCIAASEFQVRGHLRIRVSGLFRSGFGVFDSLTSRILFLRPKLAEKPHKAWSIGPKALTHESSEFLGFCFEALSAKP